MAFKKGMEMQDLGRKEKELLLKLNVEDMTPVQVRLVKSINSLVAHILTAEDESEYFDASAELIRKAAELIKQADFAHQHKDMNYGDQAVEFAVDFLNEVMNDNNVGNVDN